MLLRHLAVCGRHRCASLGGVEQRRLRAFGHGRALLTRLLRCLGGVDALRVDFNLLFALCLAAERIMLRREPRRRTERSFFAGDDLRFLDEDELEGWVEKEWCRL